MPSDCVNLAEDLYEVVCVCYLLVRWYVCVLSSSRKICVRWYVCVIFFQEDLCEVVCVCVIFFQEVL